MQRAEDHFPDSAINIIPAIITVAILTFMNSWNDVLLPLIVIRDEQLMTMPQLVTPVCRGRAGGYSITGRQTGVRCFGFCPSSLRAIFQKHLFKVWLHPDLKVESIAKKHK